ncbi:hypothetical protein IYR97_22975 (plasmid) [Pseudomonas fulva]|uniref:hypothetical protein n=1 Tax=Pseudomonas fulva TaxID=47880 RepID=UPI0018A9D20C|nr:hypothetical protein [Pseudomonas fulva]QPH46411.1 hypothetical protein IYR97_22975 [Pseudomonas fulva]
MSTEKSREQQRVIERVKCTRVVDLATLSDEDVRAFCAFQPSRFLATLHQVWSGQAQTPP